MTRPGKLHTWFRYPKLLLADSLGAFLSAALLAGILLPFESVFGMPARVLYVLLIIAVVYALFSLSCYLARPRPGKPYLRTMAIANVLYAVLTAGLLACYYSRLSAWGLLYFVLELMVLLSLSLLEWRASSGDAR